MKESKIDNVFSFWAKSSQFFDDYGYSGNSIGPIGKSVDENGDKR